MLAPHIYISAQSRAYHIGYGGRLGVLSDLVIREGIAYISHMLIHIIK